MSELSLSACPICQAANSLSRQERTMQERAYVWYECRECGSVLLWLGGEQWAYQKVGRPEKAHLLKQPLTQGELAALAQPAAVEPPERLGPVQVDSRQRSGPTLITPETIPTDEIASSTSPATSQTMPSVQSTPPATPQKIQTWLQGGRRRLWAVVSIAVVTACCLCFAVTSLLNPSPGVSSTPTPALAKGSQVKLVSSRDDSITAWQISGDCELGDPLGQLPSGTDALLLDASCYHPGERAYYYQVAIADGTECWIKENEIAPLAEYTPPSPNTPRATNTARPTSTPKSTNTPRPTNTPLPPTATPDPNLIRPGTYIVGTDIHPGIYRGQAGYGLFQSCYWARLKDLSGTLDATIANDNSIGRFYVEIAESDYAFETKCELIFLNSLPGPPDEFPQNIVPGTYIIGIDIQPGTYKGQAGTEILDSCYWARLKNVSGGMNSIIANDNATGQYYIQVQSGDFALSTKCELERVGD